MGSEKDQEEIIELTEVIAEGSAVPAGEEPLVRSPLEAENRTAPRRPRAGNDALSALPDSSPRGMKEPLTRQEENRAPGEETGVAERLAAKIIPRMVAERLSSELERLKAETDALHARGEAFSRRLEEWFSSEGLKCLEQKTREAVPRVAAEALQGEIAALQREIEKFQAQGEDLNRRVQTWFADEGKQVLAEIAREIFPQMAEKILRQEIDKLKEESRASARDS